jgi:hypothetical protein
MDANWPQLLQDNGPFALLPFACLVIERTAAKRAHDHELPERTRNGVYAAAWVMIFILCAAVVAFWGMNRPKKEEAMMRGKINGLGILQRLRGTGPETANVRVFTYRDPQQTDQVFWRTYTSSQLPQQTELAFLIDSSTDTSDKIWSYAFHPSKTYYDAFVELHLQYDPRKNTLLFENPATGKQEELPGRQVVTAADAPRVRKVGHLPWFATVFAQSKLAPGMVIANLEADDPLVRLTARKQLASLGPEAISTMDKALVKPDSSYRVKLGVIVAANQMLGFKPDGFSTSAWCEVWRDAQTGDDAMKTQANLLLKKQDKPVSASSCVAMQRQQVPLRSITTPNVGKSGK